MGGRGRTFFYLIGSLLVLGLPAPSRAQTVEPFNPIPNSAVYAVAIQHDGKILIGGAFTTVASGTIPRGYIARLNADGSLDSAFNPGADGTVRAIAVQGNGQILVGGEFSNLAGVARQRIGRLNSDGTLDAGFNPGINIAAQTAVSAIAVQLDNRILVGGTFAFIGGGTGTTARNNIARLESNGTVDGGYDPGASLRVLSIALQNDGAAVVGGLFTTIGGGGLGNTARNFVARLSNTGVVDPVFNPNAGSGVVQAIAIQADGKVLIGGSFFTLGGQSRGQIGRVNSDGSLDLGFNPGASSVIESFAVQADGKILVGGGFSLMGGLPRAHLARLNIDGSVDSFDPGVNQTVYALALQQDGHVIVAGLFNLIGGGGTGSTLRPRITRLSNDPATQSLTITGGTTITWMRGGTSPEAHRVAFQTTTDGVTYTFNGHGVRIAGGWELTGLSLPSNPNLRVRGRAFFQTGDRSGSHSVYESSATAANTNVVENNDFANGTAAGWSTFATPDNSYMFSNVINGVFHFYRLAPPLGTTNQALIFQSTGMPLTGGAPITAQFSLGNTSPSRRRMSVLLHDADFSDLHVCTFWLPGGAPLTTYGMRTHTTKAWTNMTVSFYAATTGSNGFYQLDNVSVQYDPTAPADRTECVDPTTPAAPGGGPGPGLLVNGDFASGTVGPGWTTFGQIQSQVAGNVFEFIKLAGTPTGVVLQATGQGLPGNDLLTATFHLGNSSPVRKRITAILHDNTFGDLSACTFWLPPFQPLLPYSYRTFTTQPWTNATLSIYPATVGSEQWIQLDNVTLQRTPASVITGTECLDPGPASTSDAAMAARAPRAVRLLTSHLADPVADAGVTSQDGSTPGAGAETGLHGAGVVEAGWIADGFERSGEPSPAGGPGWVATATDAGPHTLTRANPLDLTAASQATLRFQSWLSSTDARAEVQVSLDGFTWETIHVGATSDTWTPTEIDLNANLGRIVFVRFVMHGVAPPESAAADLWRLSDVAIEFGN